VLKVLVKHSMRYACGIYYDNDDLEWNELMLERNTFSELVRSARKWMGKRRNSELAWASSVTNTGIERDIAPKLIKALE